jgi:hypothetical protein
VGEKGDDLMAATRYAVMMLRHARTETQRRNFNRKFDRTDFPTMAIV